MIESVGCGLSQGSGYICDKTDEIMDMIIASSITINEKTINPGQMTSLDDHFSRAIKYIGVHKDDPKEMIFYLGFENDKYYYSNIHKLTETRIFEIFGFGHGRDFNFKNNKWK